MSIRLTIIMPFLNSHELVRRQLLHMHKNVGLNDFEDVELFIMDDGSDPPLTAPGCPLQRMQIIPTHETRPWTSSLARNLGAKIAQGDWLFMLDGDFILSRKAVEFARAFTGHRMGIRREFGVILEDGTFTQDLDVLESWGVPRSRLDAKGVAMPPHPNHFIIQKSIFWDLGGYDPNLILNRPYPQGEDNYLKKKWCQARDAGKYQDGDPNLRPTLYMFPNGQFTGDIDSNPFGLFHNLSRKSERNPYVGNTWHDKIVGKK